MWSRFSRAIASAVACAIVGALALFVAEPGATAAQSDSWASGVYPGPCKNSDADRAAYAKELTDFGAWRKQPVQYTLQFEPYTGNTNWLTTEEPNALFKCAVYLRQQLHVPMMLAVPMLPNFDTEDQAGTSAGPPTLEAGATGAYDQYWKTLATNLLNRGLGDTVMRIGWEFNGDWFKWSAVNDPPAWTAYWIHIVKAMRKVSPALKFDYSVALGATKSNPDDSAHPGKGGDGVYPGDAYVDSVSVSVYDQITGHPACTATVTTDCETSIQRWDSLRDQPYGLAWQTDFAARHNKPIGFSEWALASTDSFKGGGGGDNASFISRFHQWLVNPTNPTTKRAAKVSYEMYFDKDHSNNVQAITDGMGHDAPNFPGAEQTYKNLWAVTSGHQPSASVLPSGSIPSSSSPTSSATASSSSTVSNSPSISPSTSPSTTPPPPANTPLYSKYSSRRQPTKLSKHKVSGNIFIFVRPSKKVLYAAWYLDDPKHKKKAYRIARITPYDLVGADGRLALAFRVSHVSRGKHTLTVLLRWKTGGYRTYTVTFTR